jgi:adenylylsulfate kinase
VCLAAAEKADSDFREKGKTMSTDRKAEIHQYTSVSGEDRSRLLGQKGVVVWMTGLSAAGKTTLAYALEKRLMAKNHIAYVLDGDVLRQGLCKDLDFTPGHRTENIRRVGYVAAILADAGLIAIASFISPYISGRKHAREAFPEGRFFEIYLDVPLEVCEARDPKGLYKKARANEISNFTGISAPYEPPKSPELVLKTAEISVEEGIDRIIRLLIESKIIEE